jgi:hypothetical protein
MQGEEGLEGRSPVNKIVEASIARLLLAKEAAYTTPQVVYEGAVDDGQGPGSREFGSLQIKCCNPTRCRGVG